VSGATSVEYKGWEAAFGAVEAQSSRDSGVSRNPVKQEVVTAATNELEMRGGVAVTGG
jgi:hypothetical protein